LKLLKFELFLKRSELISQPALGINPKRGENDARRNNGQLNAWRGSILRAVEMQPNRQGDHAVSVVVVTERLMVSGKCQTIEVRACPIAWRPHPKKIAFAQRGYED
jgi:hypothetical protein